MNISLGTRHQVGMFEHLLLRSEGDAGFIAAMVTSRLALALVIALALVPPAPERLVAYEVDLPYFGGCGSPDYELHLPPPAPPDPPPSVCARRQAPRAPTCAARCHGP